MSIFPHTCSSEEGCASRVKSSKIWTMSVSLTGFNNSLAIFKSYLSMSALCYVWYLRVFSGNVAQAGSLLTVSCFIHCLVSGLFVFFSWGSDTRRLECWSPINRIQQEGGAANLRKWMLNKCIYTNFRCLMILRNPWIVIFSAKHVKCHGQGLIINIEGPLL